MGLGGFFSGGTQGAGMGALVGSVVPGVGTAVGAGAGFLLGGLNGWLQEEAGYDQAAAQQAIIEAQNQIAREQLAFEKYSRERAYQVSQPSLNEIAQIDNLTLQMTSQLRSKEKIIARDEAVIKSLDPALISAGTEVAKLINGESSKALAPIKRQREEQRKTLENGLLQRFGPGYRSSSAGILSLNDFDAETDSLMTNAQLATIGQLTNTIQGISSARPNVGQTEVAFGQLYNQEASTVLSSEDAQKRRQEQALVGSNVDYSSAIQTAGGAGVGALGVAQAQSQGYQQMFNSGNQLAGIAFGQLYKNKLNDNKNNNSNQNNNGTTLVTKNLGEQPSPDIVGKKFGNLYE